MTRSEAVCSADAAGIHRRRVGTDRGRLDTPPTPTRLAGSSIPRRTRPVGTRTAIPSGGTPPRVDRLGGATSRGAPTADGSATSSTRALELRRSEGRNATRRFELPLAVRTASAWWSFPSPPEHERERRGCRPGRTSVSVRTPEARRTPRRVPRTNGESRGSSPRPVRTSRRRASGRAAPFGYCSVSYGSPTADGTRV